MIDAAIRDSSYQRETRLGGAVASYLAWKKLRASARTLEIYEGYLARLSIHAAGRGNPGVGQVDAQLLLDALSQYDRGSVRLVRTVYSDFFKWACRWGHRDRNPVDLLPPVAEPPMKVYDVFTAAEQAQLLKATDALPMPWVHRLRVHCLIDLGIRKAEARRLQVQHFDAQLKVVSVHGKGGKQRVVPLSEDLWRGYVGFRNRPLPKVRHLDDDGGSYRHDRPPRDDDYVFFPCGGDRSGGLAWTNPAKALSDRGMHAWWQQLVETAGVRYRSMHMNRHTFGTELASAETDAFTIRDWLGHADVSTTQVYIHNSRSRLNVGMQKLEEYRRARGV